MPHDVACRLVETCETHVECLGMLLESVGILISENDEVAMSSRKYEGHAPPGSSTY